MSGNFGVIWRLCSLVRLLGAVGCLWFAGSVSGGELVGNVAKVEEVEARHVVAFLRYIRWPDSLPVGQTNPIVICVLGTDPVGARLVEEARGKTLDQRPLVLRVARTLEEVPDAVHLLFVGSSEMQNVMEMVRRFERKSVLTVGLMSGREPTFLKAGGMVGMYVNRNGYVRFGVNLDALILGRLELKSSMLDLARLLVKSGEVRGSMED